MPIEDVDEILVQLGTAGYVVQDQRGCLFI